ncbi:MAG TPA: NnrS family protein [Burkholderiaceae bacterium]|nr:NnrS family protein [Burkholderiaceae bacterium]
MKPVPVRTVLVPLLEPQPAAPGTPPHGFALFRLGFRPFYLLASLFAAVSVPLWIAQFAGALPPPSAYPAMLWHAHEMSFGFTLAVIVGFLLTAARVWTGLPTPSGIPLAGLAAVWIAARVFNYFGPSPAAMLADAAFLILPMIALGLVLVKARSHRNLFVLVVLTAFLLANTLFHLAVAGRVAFAPMAAVHFFVFTVIMLIGVIGGRVIPSFTANALPGIRQYRRRWLDVLALAATAAALLLVLLGAPAAPTVAACVVAAALQAARLAGWNPVAARRQALLWILHVSYAWIPVGLVLLACGVAGKLPISAGVHALTLGAISGLIMGMITRTALGHTARPLIAGRIEVAAYLLVQAAAMIRLGSFAAPGADYLPWIVAAASAWSLAFALYFAKYAPMLVAPRLDGRDG